MANFKGQNCLLNSYFVPEVFRAQRRPMAHTLQKFLTDARLNRMQAIASTRSRFVLPVFESTNHCHNISAVLRTVDALGFQDAFFVYTDMEHTRFRINDSVERGSADWLFCRRLSEIDECAAALKKNDYQIALVSLPSFFRTSKFFKHDLPHYTAHDLQKNDVQKKLSQKRLAIVFGNEKSGVSEQWGQWADMYVSVDMHGFVESLNVSVCAGILLHELRRYVDKPIGIPEANVMLSEDEKEFVLEHWIARNSENGEIILQREMPQVIEYFRWQKHFSSKLLID